MKVTCWRNVKGDVGEKGMECIRDNRLGRGNQACPFARNEEQNDIYHTVEYPEDDGEEMPVL
jgi:hypothetical protein